MKPKINNYTPDENEKLIIDATDLLLFISESFKEKKQEMNDMEFLFYIENNVQDVVYNLTQIIRNLTKEIDED